jgi:hypothetical protein
MMEYLELILIITMAVILFRREQEKVTLEEQISDIEGKLDGIEKLLVELQPKGPVEIPKRLSVEQLKTIFKDEFLFPESNEALKKGAGEYKKKTLTANEQNVLKELYGNKEPGVYDKDDIEEMKVWDATLMDGMDDNQYGNEGDTFSIYEDEQLKKIRKHVQERKKQSLNK